MSTSCDQKIMKDGVCERNCGINNTIDTVSNGISNMNIFDNNSSTDTTGCNISVCANCGKEGTNINNTCNKCKKVKYCNAVCKKVHKKKHKKDCEEYVRLAAEEHDEKLFKQQSPKEVCPICFLRIPSLTTGYRHMSCCGKVLCNGCCYAPVYDNQGNEVDNQKCPFCRTPFHDSDEELLERLNKRVDANDPIAIGKQGNYYSKGEYEYPQDYTKAFELLHRAGELGNAVSYYNIGYAYDHGRGVKVDKKKANHYYELAAMKGEVSARHNLGVNEARVGNIDRALKHHMIAIESGEADSLNEIKRLHTLGFATKDNYTKALRAYQTYLGEIKSEQRDEAAADDEECRYY